MRWPSLQGPIRSLPIAVGGMLLVFGGAVVQALAIVSFPWLKVSDGSSRVSYSFADFADRTQRGWAYMYFTFAAWTMLAIVLVAGVAACIRWRGARTLRYLGAILAVLAGFATVGAVVVFAHQSHDPVFKVAGDYAVGPYLAVIGLVVGGLGAAAGGTGRFGRRPDRAL